MEASVLSVRVDADIKRSFAALCDELGMTASVAVNMFMRQMLREGALPFTPALKRGDAAQRVLAREEIVDAVSSVASHHDGIESVTLFGSYARREATPESDIDLRVLCDPQSNMGLFAMSSFVDEVRELTGKSVDVISSRGLDERFAKEIARDGVKIYERS